jgi:hypothetical protein
MRRRVGRANDEAAEQIRQRDADSLNVERRLMVCTRPRPPPRACLHHAASWKSRGKCCGTPEARVARLGKRCSARCASGSERHACGRGRSSCGRSSTACLTPLGGWCTRSSPTPLPARLRSQECVRKPCPNALCVAAPPLRASNAGPRLGRLRSTRGSRSSATASATRREPSAGPATRSTHTRVRAAARAAPRGWLSGAGRALAAPGDPHAAAGAPEAREEAGLLRVVPPRVLRASRAARLAAARLPWSRSSDDGALCARQVPGRCHG